MRILTIDSLLAGTIGALAMMPAGFAFRFLEMRVGHYGPKFASLYLQEPGTLMLFIQHLVLGWVSAVPLCILQLQRRSFAQVLGVGALYGVVYYVAVNSLALPLYFGDPLPWSLGAAVVLPSLIVHIVFGIAVAYTIRVLQLRRGAT